MAVVMIVGAALKLSAPATSEVQHAGPPAGADMVQTFNEDFTGSALNTKMWNQHMGPRQGEGGTLGRRSLWANAEAEVYLDKDFLKLGIDPFSLSDGVLTITARPLPPSAKQILYGELARHPEWLRLYKTTPRMEYSSGALTTWGAFDQRYGYFEIRAKWSAGKGLWPAFWLLPTDGSWPPELDIMESLGDKPSTAYQTLHPRNGSPVGVVGQTQGVQQDFHTYGALWTPSHIDFYIDGKKTGTVASSAEMNKPMYILANFAIGGNWPGYPKPDPDFSASMAIDYIKAWQFRACMDARKPCPVE